MPLRLLSIPEGLDSRSFSRNFQGLTGRIGLYPAHLAAGACRDEECLSPPRRGAYDALALAPLAGHVLMEWEE